MLIKIGTRESKLAFSEVSGAKAEIDLIEKAVIDIRRQLEDL